ncbi:hypothetical protein GN958_ATG16377 [Phytophthora infestans]|uniref:Uncharacterized protein n=1 Tax=Phytophthora infestans TaxID=4787 RepID=A0A8S9U462_PHYIN|nr:hypothetical protein GN958_ATG16377 [Phytophthora infestans]
MDSTLQLHQTLDDKLENLASGIKMVHLKVEEEEPNNAKRKREEADEMEDASSSDSSSSSPSSGSDDDSEEEDLNRHKKMKVIEQSKHPQGSESPHASGINVSADLSLAHEALAFFTTLKPGNADMTHTWATTLFNLKLLLNRLSNRDARTDKPTAEVTSQALEAAVTAFSKLERTAEVTEQVRALLAALNDACLKNEVLRVVFYRVRDELESLEMSNPRTALETSGKVLSFKELVDKIASLPSTEKPSRILEALDVIHHVMVEDPHCTRQAEARYSADVVKYWISAIPFQHELGKAYETYASSFAEYSTKIAGRTNQVGWKRLADKLHKLIRRRRKQTKITSCVPPTLSKATTRKRDQLMAINAEATQWRDGNFTLDQLQKNIKGLGEIVSYQAKDWDFLADVNCRLCVNKLIRCSHMIPKEEQREKYLKTLKRWKKKIAAYQELIKRK